ncbi:MAG: hypothetical protein M0Z76_06990, partial [Gammaproteobacteria bacterium]|nr:hypothetical protein [Gammaproteobacteria bacterium]
GGKRLPQRVLDKRSTRLGLAWALGCVMTLALVGAVTGMGLLDRSALSAPSAGSAVDRIVLTADAAPPALWSNRWLGRHPYRVIAFDGLSHLAAGFVLSMPDARPRTVLQRWVPGVSAQIVRWRREASIVGHEALLTRGWL